MFRNEASEASHAVALPSVYEQALGERFAELDPQLRTYFGGIPKGFEGVGHGRYEEAGLRFRPLRPLFALLGRWHIAFAEHGENVPFTVRNNAAPGGTLHAVRTFSFPTVTRAMKDSIRTDGGRLIDRVGARGEVEIELELLIADGRLTMESRRLAVHVAGVRVPLPPIVRISLCERTLSREDGTQHVDVRITVPLLGDIYGYSGTFTYAVQPTSKGRAS